ncbi:MAG: hypothetical protein N3C12_08380 [Candidatus Binatia bacterium]|nr:hypothetical protein [Candidatus Binatia bacterium]
MTTAAVDLLRAVEEKGDVNEALERYSREIQEAEQFLHSQEGGAPRASLRKFGALLERHKNFLTAVRDGQNPTEQQADTGSDEDHRSTSAPARPWIVTMNELLRETGEVRSLLRQGS